MISHAQIFKPFKVDASVGYAIPGGEGAKGGVILALEPKFAAIPKLSVGVRFEAAIMARGFADVAGQNGKVDAKTAGSYLATGDYYLTSIIVRPFVGAGAGIYTLANISADNNGGSAGASSKFGGMVRAGVELSHFRIAAEYNIVPSTNVTVIDGNSTYTAKTKNGYIGIKIVAFIGGDCLKNRQSLPAFYFLIRPHFNCGLFFVLGTEKNNL